MGLVQISNRLVAPPDGLMFLQGLHGELFGTAWMALPLIESCASHHRQPTGDHSWTLFLNAANFRGPLAFWIPETWSAISNGFRRGRAHPGHAPRRDGRRSDGSQHGSLLQQHGRQGVLYSRIPKLLFPVDAKNTTVLMQDVLMYSRTPSTTR